MLGRTWSRDRSRREGRSTGMAEGENQQARGNSEAGNRASNRPAGLGARRAEVVSVDVHVPFNPPNFRRSR